MKSIESDHQIALIKWAKMQQKAVPELSLLYHIPNGGHRSITTAARMKAEGVLAGVPDLHLPVSRGGYHSLYIEMKAPKGRLSENQKRIIPLLEEENNKVVVCYSWIEAKDEILAYLAS